VLLKLVLRDIQAVAAAIEVARGHQTELRLGRRTDPEAARVATGGGALRGRLAGWGRPDDSPLHASL
jgi:hypothetical protein